LAGSITHVVQKRVSATFTISSSIFYTLARIINFGRMNLLFLLGRKTMPYWGIGVLAAYEFIDVIERELNGIDYEQERWNDGEIRAEQWAAHMHMGSRDAYFDDLNFENGRYENRRDKLVGILEWISLNCPLLWAQHEERKLSEERKAS